MNAFHPQRGIAFLYTALIFATASIVVAGLISREHLEITRTAHFVGAEQAMQYALGAELYISTRMAASSGSNADQDPLLPGGVVMPFHIPEGQIETTLEAPRGYFNINSLLSGNAEASNRFNSLCSHLEIPEITSAALLKALRANLPVIQDEDAGNVSLAGYWLVDTSELLDYGLPLHAYQALAPYITALPTTSFSININAAPSILRTIYIGNSMIESNVTSALNNGPILLEDLLKLHIQDMNMTTQNDYFTVTTLLKIGGQHYRFTSLLYHRPNSSAVAILSRRWGDQ